MAPHPYNNGANPPGGGRCLRGLLAVVGFSCVLTYILTLSPQGTELLLRGRSVKVAASTTKLASDHHLDVSSTRLLEYLSAAGLSPQALDEVGNVMKQSSQAVHTADHVAAVQEDNYWRGLHRREVELHKLKGNLSAIRPFDYMHGVYLWDWFSPDYVCPTMERVGILGDGGKWICGMDVLQHRKDRGQPCVVYSFGVNQETTFEEELTNRTGCQVYAFDPTVPGLPKSAQNVTPRIQFFKQAIGPTDGSSDDFMIVRSLPSIMKELGHTYIDVLKVDVEGAEWSTFAPLFASGLLPFGQLLIEMHYKDVPTTFDFFHNMEKAGYRVFSRESNYHTCVAPESKHLPTAIEYSFIDPTRYFSRTVPTRHATLIAAVPQPPKPNGVVYLLTRRERFAKLKHMLHLFDSNYNDRFHYPLVIFHDDLRPEDQARIRKATNSQVEFHTVSFSLPSWVNASRVPERTPCSPHSSTVGYRHMCRFLGLQVQDILSPRYEWMWRLDDDSEILDQIGYDPLLLMEQSGKKRYGFNRVIREGEHCVDGLWDLTRKFVTERGLSPTFLDSWREGTVFFNNFEISHRSLWQNPIVREFLETVDKNGGIYYTRWGDAPIRSLAVSMVLSEPEIHYFSDISYRHPYHFSEGGPLPAPTTRPLYHLEAAADYMAATADMNQIKLKYKMSDEDTVHVRLRKPRATVIIYSHASRLPLLRRCLMSLEANFNAKFQYPVHIFANGLTYQDRVELRSLVSSRLRIEPLAGLHDDATSTPKPPRGYTGNASCPFRLPGSALPEATLIETPLALNKRFEWQWRLPDTAVLTSPIDVDPFRTLVEGDKVYAGFLAHPIDGGVNGTCLRELVSSLLPEFDDVDVRMKLHRLGHAYFDPGMDITHRRVYSGQPYRTILATLRRLKQGWDEGILKSLAVLMTANDMGELMVFPSMGINLTEYHPHLPQPSNRTATPQGLVTLLDVGEGESGKKVFNLTVDSALSTAFAPRRVGFLEAQVGVPVLRPADSGEAAEVMWLMGPTLVGTANRSMHEAEHVVGSSVVQTTRDPTSAAEAYVSLSSHGGYMPQDLFQSLHWEQLYWPRAALMVEPKGAQQQAKMVVLAARVNATLIEEEPGYVVGSVLIVVHNPRQPPSRWRYDVTEVPQTTGQWHSAMALSSGGHVSTDPEADDVYIIGDVLPLPYEESGGRGPRSYGLARVPLKSLLQNSIDGMKVLNVDKEWVAPTTSVGEDDDAVITRVDLHPLFSSSSPLRSLRVNLVRSEALGRWVVPDVSEDGTSVVLKTSTQIEGPWEEEGELALGPIPAELLALHRCPSIYTLPSEGEEGLSVALVCERRQLRTSQWSKMADPVRALVYTMQRVEQGGLAPARGA